MKWTRGSPHRVRRLCIHSNICLSRNQAPCETGCGFTSGPVPMPALKPGRSIHPWNLKVITEQMQLFQLRVVSPNSHLLTVCQDTPRASPNFS